MHHLRRSRLPGLLLGLVLGFALLLPEIGHSLVHRHAAAHAAPHVMVAADHGHGESATVAHAQVNAGWADSHSAGGHHHFDLRPTPPPKVSSGLLLAARIVVELQLDIAAPLPPRIPVHAQVVLAGRYHGPPPPSRAPPLS